ncbi:hypothetical protein DNTS_028215 [Danionella cerebrum]|uniref:Uncharacterized protein n=1 Tax=Danionella cerebrum TaxID=2873325 RepID=A0A553N480_9TELE|nr:hypothetical protein DNTS_028215 [Danionella translucida]
MHKLKSHDKFNQPGWRIEQKYGSKVLIGNWLEEKLQLTLGERVARTESFLCIYGVRQFARESMTANSSNRLDYTPHEFHRPDAAVRRMGLHRSEGVPSRLLLSHHCVPSFHYFVTLYDESYGCQASSSSLPTLRSWHSDKLAWVPERSDHPLQGPPTKFGLEEAWRARVEQQREALPALSLYQASYPPHPISAFCHSHHVSMPQCFSSSQQPANRSREDLARKYRLGSSNPASPL